MRHRSLAAKHGFNGVWLNKTCITRTFLLRLAMCSFTTGKYAFILPKGSMIVWRYGASCDTANEVGLTVLGVRDVPFPDQCLYPALLLHACMRVQP